jgi:hypothetical protein
MMKGEPSEESAPRLTRRAVMQKCAIAGVSLGATTASSSDEPSVPAARPWIRVRGIYGGYLKQLLDRGETPADYGINAIWVGSGSLNAAEIDRYRKLGLKIFAEFNSMHAAQYLKEHPEAAPDWQ